jgi:hypothetical protein
MKKSILSVATLVTACLLLCLCTGTVQPSRKNMSPVRCGVLSGEIWIPAAMTVVSEGSGMLRAEGTRDSVTGRVSILTIETNRSDMNAQKESWERADSAEKHICAGTGIPVYRKPGEKSWNRAEEFIAFIEKNGMWNCVRVFQPLGVKDCSLSNFAQTVADVEMLTKRR